MPPYKGKPREGRGSSAPKGSFRDGVWYCDCTPPLPAVRFAVKKQDSPNKGKLFQTCKNGPGPGSCKFFLWDDDARRREQELATPSTSSRAGPSRPFPATPSRPRLQRVSPPPPHTAESRTPDSRRKRTYRDAHGDEDGYGLGDSSEEELGQAMEEIETPTKKVRTMPREMPAVAPPRRRLPWERDDEPRPTAPHTPQTEPRQTRHAVRSTAMPADLPSSQTMTPGSSPVDAPMHNRHKDAGPSATEADLSQDVFGALQEANVMLSEQARKNLTAILSRHATVAEGVKKGRDVARASAKAKDAKVTELTYRVSTLEAELEAERAMVKHLEWKAASGHNSD